MDESLRPCDAAFVIAECGSTGSLIARVTITRAAGPAHRTTTSGASALGYHGWTSPPRKFTPAAVRAVRQSPRVSQGVFALEARVWPQTVEHWGQGIIASRPIARRLLDMIAAKPSGYRAMLLKHD